MLHTVDSLISCDFYDKIFVVHGSQSVVQFIPKVFDAAMRALCGPVKGLLVYKGIVMLKQEKALPKLFALGLKTLEYAVAGPSFKRQPKDKGSSEAWQQHAFGNIPGFLWQT